MVGWPGDPVDNTWQVYDGDLATSSIQLPELPADLGGPSSTTTLSFYGVEVIESDAVADYAAVLAGGLWDGGEATDRVLRSTVTSEQAF